MEIEEFIADMQIPVYHVFQDFHYWDVLNALVKTMFRNDWAERQEKKNEDFNEFDDLLEDMYTKAQAARISMCEVMRKEMRKGYNKVRSKVDRNPGGDAYDSRLVLFVPRLIPKIRDFLARIRAKRTPMAPALPAAEEESAAKPEAVVEDVSSMEQAQSDRPVAPARLEGTEGDHTRGAAPMRSLSISTQKSAPNTILKNSNNPLFSRQSTGETTQNRDALGDTLHQVQATVSQASRQGDTTSTLEKHIHKLLIEPGIEPVNENVFEENSSSNHTCRARSPMAHQSNQQLPRNFTGLSIEVGAGVVSMQQPQFEELQKRSKAASRTPNESHMSEKEGVLSSREGSRLDLSFGEPKEAPRNIFGMGAEQDDNVNTGSPSFHIENFFPDMVTPKTAAARGRRQPQMHKIQAESKKPVTEWPEGSGSARILANSRIATTTGGKRQKAYFEAASAMPPDPSIEYRDQALSGHSSRKYSLSSIHSVAVSERSSMHSRAQPLERNRDTISRWTRFVGAEKDSMPEEEEQKSVAGADPPSGKYTPRLQARVFSELEIAEAAVEQSLSSIRSLD